ncbi:hypothetical protein [Cyclonatronum proteinivorum]|nr:hypothetical protein [Cyclonatronum proteinivorum]
MSQFEHIEHIGPARLPLNIAFTDNRWDQTNQIPLSVLENRMLSSDLIDTDTRSIVQGTGNDITLRVEVDFLGLYRTESGFWGGRSIIKVYDEGRNVFVGHANFDEMYRRARRPSREETDRWAFNVMDNVTDILSQLIIAYAERNSSHIRKVETFGCTPVSGQRADRADRTRALYEAFRRGANQAWGHQLESITTITDLYDVEDIIRVSGSGRITTYEIDESKTVITSDNHLCLFVNMNVQQ